MISEFVSSSVDHGSIKDYKIGICCFSAKYAAIRRKSGWLGIRIMCGEWGNMSIRGLLFQ